MSLLSSLMWDVGPALAAVILDASTVASDLNYDRRGAGGGWTLVGRRRCQVGSWYILQDLTSTVREVLLCLRLLPKKMATEMWRCRLVCDTTQRISPTIHYSGHGPTAAFSTRGF